MTGTSAGKDANAEARSIRRAVLRDLHPDRGGDPDAFIAALRDLDRPTPTAGTVGLKSRGHRLRRVSRGGWETLRRIRSRLPYAWPGSRRYGHL